MSRIEALDLRYKACAALERWGVEIVAVGDPVGAHLNALTNRLAHLALDGGSEYLDELVRVLKALRWRRVTHAVPVAQSPWLAEMSAEAASRARRLRGSVGEDDVLDDLVETLAGLAAADPPHGALLLRSLEEAGVRGTAVVAVNNAARASLAGWLEGLGASVFTAHDLSRTEASFEQLYAAGPPRFFGPSLVSSPVAEQVTFIMPAWFADRSVPCSAIASRAERPVRVSGHTKQEGDFADPVRDASAEPAGRDDDDYDSFMPQPAWRELPSIQREPRSDEVVARKVLLAGELAIWLDDGDRIRAIDPAQPTGERVTYLDVRLLRAGDCLLLRQGSTERRALYEAALELLGPLGPEIDSGQRAWKAALSARLRATGERMVVRQLEREGVRAADRARAWTDPSLIRPISDSDFQRLLNWLGMPVAPTFGNATLLRRMLYQASADVREELETSVAAVDLSALDRDGHLALDLPGGGFRGLIATRVLAISPHTAVVPRHDARVPFSDRGALWLE